MASLLSTLAGAALTNSGGAALLSAVSENPSLIGRGIDTICNTIGHVKALIGNNMDDPLDASHAKNVFDITHSARMAGDLVGARVPPVNMAAARGMTKGMAHAHLSNVVTSLQTGAHALTRAAGNEATRENALHGAAARGGMHAEFLDSIAQIRSAKHDPANSPDEAAQVSATSKWNRAMIAHFLRALGQVPTTAWCDPGDRDESTASGRMILLAPMYERGYLANNTRARADGVSWPVGTTSATVQPDLENFWNALGQLSNAGVNAKFTFTSSPQFVQVPDASVPAVLPGVTVTTRRERRSVGRLDMTIDGQAFTWTAGAQMLSFPDAHVVRAQDSSRTFKVAGNAVFGVQRLDTAGLTDTTSIVTRINAKVVMFAVPTGTDLITQSMRGNPRFLGIKDVPVDAKTGFNINDIGIDRASYRGQFSFTVEVHGDEQPIALIYYDPLAFSQVIALHSQFGHWWWPNQAGAAIGEALNENVGNLSHSNFGGDGFSMQADISQSLNIGVTVPISVIINDQKEPPHWEQLGVTIAEAMGQGVVLHGIAVAEHGTTPTVNLGTLALALKPLMPSNAAWTTYVAAVLRMKKIRLPATPAQFIESSNLYGFASIPEMIESFVRDIAETPALFSFAPPSRV